MKTLFLSLLLLSGSVQAQESAHPLFPIQPISLDNHLDVAANISTLINTQQELRLGNNVYLLGLAAPNFGSNPKVYNDGNFGVGFQGSSSIGLNYNLGLLQKNAGEEGSLGWLYAYKNLNYQVFSLDSGINFSIVRKRVYQGMPRELNIVPLPMISLTNPQNKIKVMLSGFPDVDGRDDKKTGFIYLQFNQTF